MCDGIKRVECVENADWRSHEAGARDAVTDIRLDSFGHNDIQAGYLLLIFVICTRICGAPM